MNETEHNPQRQGKKIIKKYILHQKVNPRLLGVELFNKQLVTPYEAYLSCKLIFKKDIQSLMELEQVAKRIQEAWTEKNDTLLIKKINIFTSPAYIVLTFTIGFFEQEQVRSLRVLKECAKELIETNDEFIKQEQDAHFKRKEEEIYGILEKCSQLTKKMEGLEDRLIKNESIVLGSGELLKNELTKVSQTIKAQMDQAEHKMKDIQKHSEDKKQEAVEKPVHVETGAQKKNIVSKKSPPVQKFSLNPSRQQQIKLEIKGRVPIRLVKKDIVKRESIKKNVLKKPVSQVELEVLKCFTTESEELSKKRMIPKKQFLILKEKVEFIDYLWMLLEIEGKEEIIVAGKLSCRELIKELGQFMEAVEKVAVGPTIFNYWVYCSQELLVKLEGYAALKNLLSSSLKLSNESINTILINEA
ncbi:hypothetical protein ACWOC1_11965 [Enterococcus quebecensis]|uniref:Uncharacterized protein n=1 Tax=Enterococcus quebecensis TaxID=903983 RepID=A0A1E5GTU3_9ENTE|nr:hypothetical protein [Enterococcus quebecensis]OEG16075.1 hypothetical protein BCR23_07975 [Enterococcus quebecensis]